MSTTVRAVGGVLAVVGLLLVANPGVAVRTEAGTAGGKRSGEDVPPAVRRRLARVTGLFALAFGASLALLL